VSPLKRREELQALSEDHHNVLVIALRCRRLAAGALDVDRAEYWASVIEFYALQIVPHFEVEERYLLPALCALGETEMAERILDEHERLRAMMTNEIPDDSALNAFGQLLDDHIRYEERVVFEATQDRLAPEWLAEIQRASAEAPQICPTTFRHLPRASAKD
jgi:hemerythrin-like domain-containing protein